MRLQKNYRSQFQWQASSKIFAVLFCILSWQSAIEAQTLKADYQFQGNLSSSVAGAPSISNFGGQGTIQTDTVDGYSRQTFRFPAGGGLSVNTIGLIPTNAYTAVILFRFDTVTGRRRVFDAKQGTSNLCGLYISNGRLEPEPTTTTLIYPNTYIQVAVVRESSGAMRFYRDGYVFNVPTDSGCYENTNNSLRFFIDDTVVGGETSAGNVARIRLYDAPMTGAQLRALDRPANANGGGDQAILFSTSRDGFAEIYSMNSDGGNQRRLTNNAVPEYNARWSPDKTKIVFVRREAATGSTEQIWMMNADGGGQTRLTNTTTNDHAPSFKPDGSKIIFSRCDANFICDIYTMNPDGTNQQPFNGAASAVEDEDLASYSPDGSRIVFSRINPDPAIPTSGLYALNTDNTNFVRLTGPALPIGDRGPRYSPNGSKIVFARFPDVVNGTNGSGIEIYTINPDGSGETRITNNAVLDNRPVWSPDSTRLAFHSQRDIPINELYTMNAATGGSVARLTSNSVSDFMEDWFSLPIVSRRTPFDFDGDGKTDLSIFRPAPGEWWYNKSTNGGNFAAQFGTSSDKLVPGDYTGDGKSDFAFFRPSTGQWFVLRSENFSFFAFPFGISTDTPVPADYDGDGKTDAAVFRASDLTWYISRSSGGTDIIGFGSAGDLPVAADYDGDGKADIAIFRPNGANGAEWWLRRSSTGAVFATQFGTSTDKTVQGDFTGDGKADIAFWRPSTGFWNVLRSEDFSFYAFPFGAAGDVPVPGDYDGDGKFDAGVFRQPDAQWFVNKSTGGTLIQQFGITGDLPLPNAYVR